METIDNNTGSAIRSMTLQELVAWFAERKDISLDEADSKEIYDLWATLQELDTSSGLTQPYRGMVLFKISSILGIRSTGTRFTGDDTYSPWSKVDPLRMKNFPRLFVELHSWIMGNDIRGEMQAADYVISQKNTHRLTNILEQVTSHLETLSSASSAGNSHHQVVLTSSVYPTELVNIETNELVPGDMPISDDNTDVKLDVPLHYWVEGLYTLALRISDGLFDVKDCEHKTSLNDALRKVDAVLQMNSMHRNFASIDIDHKTRIELTNRIKDDQFWVSPVVNIVQTEGLSDTPRVDFEEVLSIGHADYCMREMLVPKSQEAEAPPKSSLQHILQPSVDRHLDLIRNDFEFLEPELWRTRTSYGYFQAFRTVMNLSRYDPSVLSLIVKECPNVRASLCSVEALERILKEILETRIA